MKKLSFLIVSLLSIQAIFAQGEIANEIKITWGPEHEAPKKFDYITSFASPEKGIVRISHKKMKELTFQLLGMDKLEEKKKKTTNIEKLGPKLQHVRSIALNEKYFLVFKTIDKKDNRETLFAKEFDFAQLDLKSSTKLLIERNTAERLNKSIDYREFFEFQVSNDKSKVMVVEKKYPDHRNNSINKDVLRFYVYDDGLNTLWSKEIEMPHTEMLMDYEDFQVDSRGNAFLLAKVFHNKREDEIDGVINYHYEMMKLSKGSNEMEKYRLDLGENHIDELSLLEYAEGKMMCTGYYYKSISKTGLVLVKSKASGASGLMVARLKGNLLSNSFHEFPMDLLTNFEFEKEVKDIEKREEEGINGLKNLNLRNIHTSTDGSIVVNGEVYFMKTTGGTESTSVKFYYKNIVSIKIDANDNMAWVKKIPKFQKSNVYGQTMSFKTFNFNDDFYFFYVDNPKNLNLKPDEAPELHFNKSGGFLTVVKIDGKTGKLKKDLLLDFRKYNVKVYPPSIKKISDSSLLVFPVNTERGGEKVFKLDLQ